MGTKLYVGNLPFNTTENELQELFSQAGAVQEVTLMQDRFTGKSRGYAFVTMSSDEEAQNAISKLNGHAIEGRQLTVNEARPRRTRRLRRRRRIRWPSGRWRPAKRPLTSSRITAPAGHLGRAGFEPAK